MPKVCPIRPASSFACSRSARVRLRNDSTRMIMCLPLHFLKSGFQEKIGSTLRSPATSASRCCPLPSAFIT